MSTHFHDASMLKNLIIANPVNTLNMLCTTLLFNPSFKVFTSLITYSAISILPSLIILCYGFIIKPVCPINSRLLEYFISNLSTLTLWLTCGGDTEHRTAIDH
ncbi:MAG: hypothetical protein ACE5HX_10925, partial [bacterium]